MAIFENYFKNNIIVGKVVQVCNWYFRSFFSVVYRIRLVDSDLLWLCRIFQRSSFSQSFLAFLTFIFYKGWFYQKYSIMALQKLAMDSISLDGKRVFMRYNIWSFSLKMILCINSLSHFSTGVILMFLKINWVGRLPTMQEL